MEQEFNEILKCIDKISVKGYKSKFTEVYQKSVSEQSQRVCEYLGITSERQSILWSILFSMTVQKNSSIDLEDMSMYLNTSMLKILLYQSDFDELVKKKLLRRKKSSRRRRNSESLNYLNLFVPNDIIVSLINGEMTLPKRRKNDLTIYEILDVVYSILKERDEELIDYEQLCLDISELMNENKDQKFVKKILKFRLPVHEQILLLYVCYQFKESNTSVDLVGVLKTLFSETQSQLHFRKDFIDGKTKLQHPDLDLVDLESESFRSDKSIQLTPKGRDLFGDDQYLFVDQEITKHKDIILSSSITEQKLFFNEKEQKSIDTLTDLLLPDHFNSIVNRMRDMGLKPQITVLLHGKPGTGKTQSVYQLSRITGRDIKRVEISETKNHFFGDSEKLTTKVFQDYSRLHKSSELTPILFINEIDGWLGKRSTGGSSSVDQTENSIQSLILQHMEDFEGILFGTTNIWERLDKSYERRFLYKVLFENPEFETRFKIWKYKLPLLTDKDTQFLSETFNFSGGQVDNVVKKTLLTQILTGKNPDLKEIMGFCDEECLEKKSERNKIGFKIGSV